jgi:multidrug efflux pump subunit AcrB
VGSRLTGSLEERTIRLRGRLDGPADFERLAISETNGRVVRLGDVATVRDGTEEPRTAAYFNGHEAVGIDIVKSKGYSTTSVAEGVRAWNPVFDVTPHELIDAIVTERGVIRHPDAEAMRSAFGHQDAAPAKA